MRYLALGDSISIDLYTGRTGGGAASQFAKLIGANEVQDLTSDGCTTDGVLAALTTIEGNPDYTTLTIGGNDLMAALSMDRVTRGSALVLSTLERINRIVDSLHTRYPRARLILNTIYDPTDGNRSKLVEFGFGENAPDALQALNNGIVLIWARYGLVIGGSQPRPEQPGCKFADLTKLFHGHGFWSPEPWLTQIIEPNLAGATAIARRWHELVGSP